MHFAYPSEELLRFHCEMLREKMEHTRWIQELDRLFPDWITAKMQGRFRFIVTETLGELVAREYDDNFWDSNNQRLVRRGL